MQSSHTAAAVSASFTDPNLIASAGLVPPMRLAERHGLPDLISQHVSMGVSEGANPAGKAVTIVAGMCAGADSIDDLDMLRIGGMDKAFETIYAPSTLGSFLRVFTHGHVRQLQAATSRFTAGPIGTLGMLGDSDVIHLDIDSKFKQVYGPAKQGASFGYTKVRGLHFLIVTASTPHSRPVIVATRLRAGKAGSGRGAACLVKEAIRTLRAAGVTATILVRADSAFFSAKLVAACRDAPGVHFSITVANRPHLRASIAKIPDDAWTPIKYRHAVWDADAGRWVSEVDVGCCALYPILLLYITGTEHVGRYRDNQDSSGPAKTGQREAEDRPRRRELESEQSMLDDGSALLIMLRVRDYRAAGLGVCTRAGACWPCGRWVARRGGGLCQWSFSRRTGCGGRV
jgi:hypothetical protein